MHTLQSHKDIYRTINGADDCGDVFFGHQSRRIEHIGSSLLIGLKAFDGVVEIGASVQVVLGAGRQHEGKRKRVRGFSGSADSISGVLELVNRLLGFPSSVFDGASSKASGCT